MKSYKSLSLVILLALFASTNISAEPFYPTKQDYNNSEAFLLNQKQILEERSLSSSTSSRGLQTDPDLGAVWTGATPWMSGINFGMEAYGGAIGLGSSFFGTSLTGEDYVPVLIELNLVDTTLCQVFRRDMGYASNGVGIFLGAAYDMTNPGSPRRLNICFVEASSAGTPNLKWDPNTSSNGKREYLFIMDSDYDGNGTTYAGINIASSSPDVQYAWWPKVTSGYTFFENQPAQMEITPYHVKNFYYIPASNTEIDLHWKYFGSARSAITKYVVYRDTFDPPTTKLDSTSSIDYNDATLAAATTYYYRIEGFNGSDSLVASSPVMSAIGAVNSYNMDLLGAWNERSRYGDCWGYYDPVTDKEYALICARDEGVSIIDLSSLPYQEVSFIAPLSPDVDSKDIKIYQDYAILINEYSAVEIHSIADILNPVLVSTIAPNGGSGTHNCAVSGDYLYLIGNHGTGGIEIFDISNPASPVWISDFEPYYYHDIDIVGDVLLGTAIYGQGIDIIDISNKASLSITANFNYTGSGAHNVAITPDLRYAYIGDEIGSTGNHTRVFDISNTASISMVDEFIIDPSAPVHNCYIKDDYLYIAHYSLGTRVWDISSALFSTEYAYYETYSGSAVGYVGNWNVYPYLPSGKILSSDMQTGLYVTEVNLPTTCCDVPGDVDNNGAYDIADLTFTVNYYFKGGTGPYCNNSADIDASCGIDLLDLTGQVNYLFKGGPAPVCGCVDL